jgi:hypothetical protein
LMPSRTSTSQRAPFLFLIFPFFSFFPTMCVSHNI